MAVIVPVQHKTFLVVFLSSVLTTVPDLSLLIVKVELVEEWVHTRTAATTPVRDGNEDQCLPPDGDRSLSPVDVDGRRE